MDPCPSEETTVSRSLRVPIVVSAAAALSLALAAPASADQAFHTERFPLTPVAGAPLKSGAVIDIHTEGPTVYALERYQLVGAEPGATYVVTLLVHGDAGCDELIIPVETATFTTNAAGNGHGQARFVPADVAGLPTGTYFIDWQVSEGGSVAYSTGCVPVALD